MTPKLHIGSGSTPLPGWTNVDLAPYAGVDAVLDVRHGLPFSGVGFIFAEHFLERLTLAEGLAFLRECRRVLLPAGVLRLSTPNLDWVWQTHYKPPLEMTARERLLGCLELNRAFHGWGHRFLFNLETLTLALLAAGLATVRPLTYDESGVPELRGLERHERHADLPDLPSVVVVEGDGEGSPGGAFEAAIAPYVRDAAVA